MSNKSLVNRLTWSASRFSTIQRCEKQYYFRYIGSWGGWDFAAPPAAQDAYHHKYLTSAELEIGILVHDRIKSIFERARKGRRIPLGDEVKIAQGQFQLFLHRSRNQVLENVTRKGRMLLRDLVGMLISQTEEAEYLKRIEVLIRGLFGLRDVQVILAEPDILIPEFLDTGSFEIGQELGVPAQPKTDAVWISGDELVIADWKCGRPSESHREQGLTYDIYIRRRLGLSALDSVEVRFYYLATGEAITHNFSSEEREDWLWQVGEQFETLRSYSSDPEINQAPDGRFLARPSPRCVSCPFHPICSEFKKSAFAQENIQEAA